jgi:serine protease Do
MRDYMARRRGVLALAVFLGLGGARESLSSAQEAPNASQRLALYAKPAVVRIVSGWEGKFVWDQGSTDFLTGAEGSGFFLSANGYIATNAHVVKFTTDGREKGKSALVAQFISKWRAGNHLATDQETEKSLSAHEVKLVDESVASVNYVVLSNGDKLTFEVKQHGSEIGEDQQKDCAVIKVSTHNAPTLALGDAEKVQVEDRVIVIGYPGAADVHGVLDDKSALEASVTDGTISRVVRANAGDQIIQVSAPTFHGNSGGPAINQNGDVIGLLTFGNEEQVQGFNFLVSSSTLAEYVREAGVGEASSPSPTTTAWRTAVDLFFDRRYSAAIDQLQEVLGFFPAHADAQKLMVEARDLRRAGKERMPVELMIGGGVAAIALLGLPLVVVRSRKKRARSGRYEPVTPSSSRPDTGPSTAGVLGSARPQPAPSASVQATVFASGRHGMLTCTRGALRGQRFTLTGEGVLIGRQPGVAQVIVDDGRASGQHCWVRWEGERLFAVDQSTTNGTFVNDPSRGRISRAELKNGDVLIIADPECCSLAVTIS